MSFTKEEISSIFEIDEELYNNLNINELKNILNMPEFNKLLLHDKSDLIYLKEYIIFLSNQNTEEKTAVYTLIKSFNNRNM